jgi:phospholipase C
MESTPRWNDPIPDHLEGAARINALNRREFLRRSAATAGIAMSAASMLSPGRVFAEAIRAQRAAVPLGDAMPIDHFVILMMENRSFDHYFGWLGAEYGDKVRASQHQTYKDASGKEYATRHHTDVLGPDAQWQGCGFGDPGHGWSNGRAQLNGGFMANGAGNDEFALTYFNEGELGFIHPAAKAFTLYENYHCSLLGPTWPNRYYKWSGQSGGLNSNTPPVATAGNQWDTIFDRAMAANPAQIPGMGPTAKYYNSDLPFSAVWGARAVPWTHPAETFYADAAAGTLANITIIDPPFRDGGGFDGDSADEHPLGDVRLGQAFMSDVAHAVMSSPLWPRTAMFIVYDEWGGFFDHVRPPKASDQRANADLNLDYSQMGFRTPTVVLSPYTLGGGVSTLGPFGHESILRLIEQRFAFAPLCQRTRDAMSIGESFNWKADPNAPPPDLPAPSHIVSKPCSMGGGDISDGGVHDNDMAGLEELAHRFGIPVGEGKPHQIFQEPHKVQSAYVSSKA